MRRLNELVTSKKKLVSELVTSNKLSSLDIRNKALTIAEGLTSTEKPHDMTAWYCSCYKKLGEAKYTTLTHMARKGKNPKRLFGYLLGEEMKK